MTLSSPHFLYHLLELLFISTSTNFFNTSSEENSDSIFSSEFPILGIYLLSSDFSISRCLYKKGVLLEVSLEKNVDSLTQQIPFSLETIQLSMGSLRPQLLLLPAFHLQALNLSITNSGLLFGNLHHFWLLQSATKREDVAIQHHIPTLQLYHIKDWIVQHFADPPYSISYWAREVGSNETYLKKEFKQLFGCSIYQLQMSLRLEKAHALLITRYESVYEVALACGFNSYNTFYKAFVKHFGYCPKHVLK